MDTMKKYPSFMLGCHNAIDTYGSIMGIVNCIHYLDVFYTYVGFFARKRKTIVVVIGHNNTVARCGYIWVVFFLPWPAVASHPLSYLLLSPGWVDRKNFRLSIGKGLISGNSIHVPLPSLSRSCCVKFRVALFRWVFFFVIRIPSIQSNWTSTKGMWCSFLDLKWIYDIS